MTNLIDKVCSKKRLDRDQRSRGIENIIADVFTMIFIYYEQQIKRESSSGMGRTGVNMITKKITSEPRTLPLVEKKDCQRLVDQDSSWR